MKNSVYLLDTNIYNYDNQDFNPSSCFKECINLTLKSDKNIYKKVRDLFIAMNLDKDNIGKNCWNPFKDFINKGDKVIIKPNLVNHLNKISNNGTNCLITNFSVIRPVIDYVIKALDGTGKIIIGDSPVQECIFSEVIKINGLEDAIKKYNENGYCIKLLDFRQNNFVKNSRIVSLGYDSSLTPLDDYYEKYAIPNYNLDEIHKHHRKGIHEYLISQDILDADVIINMPKPKTHKKAGLTCCMKNFIGINCKKEYLPHHRTGSVYYHGDEFPERSIIKQTKAKIKTYNYKNNYLLKFGIRGLSFFEKILKKNKYLEGGWYGNDTLWRTILDINKIVLYADKDGKMTNKYQRKIFNVVDMIVAGEKEGPMAPSPKESGILMCGFNSLNIDYIVCQLMGFETQKIKYIDNGYKEKKYQFSNNDKFDIFLIENTKAKKINKKELEILNKHFIPSDGWIDYLLRK